MLQTTININVDFYDKKHILINAKQLDRDSRFLSVTCYNHGELYSLNNGEHAAYVRYRKADNYGVFNNCDINNKGKIVVKLTEQMLAADGICYADLVIVNRGEAEVNPNTGEINELIANASVLSTMTFCIDVSEVPVANSDIESTHEFILLNENLERYWADFEDVMKTSKSWAVGSTGIRDSENTNNSYYWSTQSQNSASAANTSALNAAESERIAGEHKDTAIVHSGNAYTYMTNANDYMNRAIEAETNADNSASAAKTSETNAKTSETNAKTSETNALASEEKAKVSETNSKTSETNALRSEEKAKISETNAKTSEEKAKVSETNAATSENNAKNAQSAAEEAENNAKQAAAQAAQNAVDNVNTLMSDYVTASQEAATSAANSEELALASETNAKISEANAKISEQAAANSATSAYTSEEKAFTSEANASSSEANALGYADIAKSYAVGNTGIRDGEDTDNSYYYYELIKNIVVGLDTGFIPMGTISFSELASVEKATGYVYNISDDFVTDESFREGAGKSYTAGTNVYYCASGVWDAFGGAASPTATVNEVKDYLGI